MKLLKTIRLRGSDMMSGFDMSHGSANTTLPVPLEGLERKGQRNLRSKAKGREHFADDKLPTITKLL
jgi:hypothetical protein